MKFFKYILLFSLASIFIFSTSNFSSGWMKSQISNRDTNFIHNNSYSKRDSDWSKENVVVYHWRAEPDNLHPTNGKSLSRRVVMNYTQRFLVSLDYERLALRPDLIKTLPIESMDGLTYTYELRDEPRWDDGTQLSVDDVIFTLMAVKCPYTNNAWEKNYFEILKNITVDRKNKRKFYLHMKEKYIQNVVFLADMPIMQRKYFDPKNVLGKYKMEQFNDSEFVKTEHKDLEDWAKEMNDPKYGNDVNHLPGLGAYQVNSWDAKQQLTLTKKKEHWTYKLKNPDIYNVSYPDKIIFKIITDDNAIGLELKKQILDVSSWVSTKVLAELQKDSDFNRNYYSAFVPTFDYQYIGMNMKSEAVNRSPFFIDKRVRRAMALLIPIDQMNQVYFQGKAIRQNGLVSPLKRNVYDNSLDLLPFDIEKAKKLLDDAGWKDSDGDGTRDKTFDGTKTQFDFELLIISGTTITENMANDIQAAMMKVGIKMHIRSVEFVSFYDLVQQHNFDMYIGAWAGTVIADDYKQIWHSSSYPGGSNFVGFGNEKSDALIDSIRTTPNNAKRIPMEKRLQEIVYDEQPYIFLFSIPRKVVIHKRFANDDMYFEKPGVLLNNLKLIAQ
jgi:peptide/nickel transport system substrate-binding protein